MSCSCSLKYPIFFTIRSTESLLVDHQTGRAHGSETKPRPSWSLAAAGFRQPGMEAQYCSRTLEPLCIIQDCMNCTPCGLLLWWSIHATHLQLLFLQGYKQFGQFILFAHMHAWWRPSIQSPSLQMSSSRIEGSKLAQTYMEQVVLQPFMQRQKSYLGSGIDSTTASVSLSEKIGLVGTCTVQHAVTCRT